MSRRLIGGIIAAVIPVLTVVAYFVTTSDLEDEIRTDIKLRVERAQQQLIQNASLVGLGLLKRDEALSTDPALARALKVEGEERSRIAETAFQDFIQSLKPGEAQPDIVALTDAKGDLIVQRGVPDPLPKKWKDSEDRLEYPGLELALTQRHFISEVWDFEKEGLMQVGVGPIIDTREDVVIGALVLAYAMTSQRAEVQAALLGTDVVYFHASEISATSFAGDRTSRTPRFAGSVGDEVAAVLTKEDLGKTALSKELAGRVVSVPIGGQRFLATAGRMPRFPSKQLPDDYPTTRAGAMVMMSLSAELALLRTIELSILLLGLAAFILAILANIVTARGILAQADEIEDGINEIIQGNFERTIRAVGAELDGLAHALNVMLARLLGRPEPGEEEYDEYGNVVQAAPVNFDNEALPNRSPADEAAMMLAQEAEPEYYSRLFNEYIEAREQIGDSTEGINYENFVTKLRLNESNLKVRYQCSAVRFRVVVSGDKVTLKPVPIV